MKIYQPFQIWQLVNETIYGKQNSVVYTRTADLVAKVSAYAKLINESARPDTRPKEVGKLRKNAGICFSWCMATANRRGIPLDMVVWELFRYRCPYCGNCPCSREDGPRREFIGPEIAPKPDTLWKYQQMFYRIYPHNTLERSALHLIEESIELIEAVQALDHGAVHPRVVRKELVDVIANLFGVVNCADIHLENTLYDMYHDGCHRCHRTPCDCGFTLSAGSTSIPPTQKSHG